MRPEPCYNEGMKENSTLPQGTPRTDNPNILEWYGPNDNKVLQLVKTPTLDYYRFEYPEGDPFRISCNYSTKRWSLWQMLDLLNR